jgi:protein-disulfide isomerase
MSKFPRNAALWSIIVTLVLAVGFVRPAAIAQTKDQVLATINGRKITQTEVDLSILSQLFPLEEQMYTLRKVALENLLLRAVLENEAAKQGKSVEELKKQLTAAKVQVSPDELDQVYAENSAAFGTMDPEEVRQRLELDLETQARMQNYREALLKLRGSSSIQVYLHEPRLPVLGDNNAPFLGPMAAAITITEFSDFLCPYCRNSQAVIKQVLQSYKSEVRLVFKHLPLDIHKEAFASARAAFCAGQQGAFWQYHDALFVSESFTPAAFNRKAAEQNLNIPDFKTCLTSNASRDAILKDTRDAKQFGIAGTPAFIVNGKLIRGAISFEEFKAIIERELKIAHNLPLTDQP